MEVHIIRKTLRQEFTTGFNEDYWSKVVCKQRLLLNIPMVPITESKRKKQLQKNTVLIEENSIQYTNIINLIIKFSCIKC